MKDVFKPQAVQLPNGVMSYYLPPSRREIPRHGTLAFDKRYEREFNPYPAWRFNARS